VLDPVAEGDGSMAIASARRRTTGVRVAVAAGLLAAAATLVGAAPVGAIGPTPPPAVDLTQQDPAGAVDVFGETAAGDVFYNRPTVDPKGAVLHADGSVTALPVTLAGRGDLGGDGRLWLPIGGALWAFGGDGSSTQYPITTSSGTTTTGLNEVRAGIDGRIWFLDTQRSRIGSIATDGTGATAWTVTGTRGLEHLARGVDGRMWATRGGGVLHAIDPSGAVTTHPSIGSRVEGLASNPSGLYGVVDGRLLRISSAGVPTAVSLPVAGSVSGAPVASDGWIWIGAVTAVSPSGRILQYTMPVDYLPTELQSGIFVYPDRVAVAPSQAGGFIGVVGPRLVHVASPDVGENLRVRASVVARDGANFLHVVATAQPVNTPSATCRRWGEATQTPTTGASRATTIPAMAAVRPNQLSGVAPPGVPSPTLLVR